MGVGGRGGAGMVGVRGTADIGRGDVCCCGCCGCGVFMLGLLRVPREEGGAEDTGEDRDVGV